MRVLVLLLFAFFGCRVEPTFAECDGPTMPPEPTDPCPPGRTAASRECPMDTCRICRTELGVPDGPAIFWTVRWTEIEVIPDEHGRWGNSRQPVRGPVVMAMWFDQGRPHGAARGFTAEGRLSSDWFFCRGDVLHVEESEEGPDVGALVAFARRASSR